MMNGPIDKIVTAIILQKDKIIAKNKTPRYLVVHKKLYEKLMEEFKGSLMYSELEHSFLAKIERLQEEIGRYDLKISVGMFHGLHLILSDVLNEEDFLVL